MSKVKAIVDNLNNERVATLVKKEFKWKECEKCWNCYEDEEAPMCSFCMEDKKPHPF